jgi:hypothetical protein
MSGNRAAERIPRAMACSFVFGRMLEMTVGFSRIVSHGVAVLGSS